eukprot:6989713-Alexandrium_andersonii.AAC.1
MQSLSDWACQFGLAAERLEATATALLQASRAGRFIDDYEFVEKIKEVEVMIGRFKDKFVLADGAKEEGRAWCHRLAPFRRIEAVVQLHAPRCSDAGRLAAS